MSIPSMSVPTSRRVAAATGVAALMLGGLAAISPGAASTTPGERGSAWVTDQLLPNGGVPGAMGEDVADWGLTLDVLFAAVATGSPDKPINQMWQGIRANAVDYAGPSYGSTRGGQSAKVALGALVVGEDPRAVPVAGGGRVDFIAQTAGLIDDGPGTTRGRLMDKGGFDNANMFGQSLALMAFSNPAVLPRERDNAQALADHLLTQQCRAGHWRMFSSDGKTCDEADSSGAAADNDGSAMALMALDAAQRGGLDVPASAIDRGVADLERRQRSDGGWGGGVSTEGTNSNSTGLVVAVLSSHGRSASAARGRAYVASLQASGGLPTGSGADNGAIAYNAASLADARANGIGVARDQWRRATAQAVLAMSPANYADLRHDFAPAAPPTSRPSNPDGSGDGPGAGSGSNGSGSNGNGANENGSNGSGRDGASPSGSNGNGSGSGSNGSGSSGSGSSGSGSTGAGPQATAPSGGASDLGGGDPSTGAGQSPQSAGPEATEESDADGRDATPPETAAGRPADGETPSARSLPPSRTTPWEPDTTVRDTSLAVGAAGLGAALGGLGLFLTRRRSS